jgi:hypothetical protein
MRSDSESDYCLPLDSSTEYNSTIPYSLSLNNDNDSTIPYSLDSTVTIELEDCHTSTPLSAHDDTTVTIEIGDNSSQYDYDIASLDSSATVKYGDDYDTSLTIPKTV